MLPTIDNNDYPKFVADQLLTAAALNDVFGYLDEQERLTRANLLGIGIVCGLHVIRHGDAIEITKGCGVTSAGYLVVEHNQVDDIAYNILPTTKKYTGYKYFNALQPRYYEKFVDISDPNNKKQVDLYEMFPASVTDATPFDASFLSDKAVLIFVELKEDNNKNCDPDSCDDKGIKVVVTYRKLLIKKTDAQKLIQDTDYSAAAAYKSKQPGVSKRFDVVATELASTTDIFEAYQKVLDASSLSAVEQLLTHAYDNFKPLILDLYATNPFVGLANQFNFIHNGTANKDQLINFQYYYDFFIDLRDAYAELRDTGVQIIGQCVPDNFFPRHLLLGEATGTSQDVFSTYRNYFTPSPLVEKQHHLVEEFRFLFRKIKLMITNFVKLAAQQALPGVTTGTDTTIRITPSLLGDYPLSKKAIPFYYKVMDGSAPYYLYNFWNYKKYYQNAAQHNLSYHATTYNTTDDNIRQPLLYDLEHYNFLRIEGIIGKPYQYVISNLLDQREKYRLPFQVVALGANARALWDFIKRKPSQAEVTDLVEDVDRDEIFDCHFQDLEALYDAMVAELTCTLCKEMKYYYALPIQGVTGLPATSDIPTISLLKKCDPGFRYQPNTVGHLFEQYYNSWKGYDDIGVEPFTYGYSSLYIETLLPTLMFRMQKLYESLAENLNQFEDEKFSFRYEKLMQAAEKVKDPPGTYPVPNEDLMDHLDSLIYTCRKAGIKSLMEDYYRRVAYVFALKKLGYFVKKHPGIQHKAGVPMGGTFIVVYHEKRKQTGTVQTGNFYLRGKVVSEGKPVAAVVVVKEMPYTAVTNAQGDFYVYSNRLPCTLMIITAGWAVKEFTINDVHDADEIDLSSGNNSENPDLGDFLKEFPEPTTDNAAINNLANEIQEGTVIADFYLPYSCCSDCPPIQSSGGKTETPQVQPVTITLQPDDKTGTNEYCVSDTKAYTFTVSPAGGTVTGPAGISQASGVFTFTPSQTAAYLGSVPQKHLAFTYTKDGQTATVTAIVYNKPNASFLFFEGDTPTKRVFMPTGAFGETYTWHFSETAESTDKVAIYDFQKEGRYEVVLVVTNGPCRTVKKQEVVIKRRQEQSCTPAGPIIESFKALPNIDQQFPEFRNVVTSFEELESVMADLEGMLDEPVEAQIEFFESVDITRLMMKLMEGELLPLIMDNKALRLLALHLYAILSRLAMYIACIQNEDFPLARVPMQIIFDAIANHLDKIGRVVDQFSTAEKQVLSNLKTAFQQELNKTDSAAKPMYAEYLEKIIELMNHMPL